MFYCEQYYNWLNNFENLQKNLNLFISLPINSTKMTLKPDLNGLLQL